MLRCVPSPILSPACERRDITVDVFGHGLADGRRELDAVALGAECADHPLVARMRSHDGLLIE
jgi:hypothetical protein